MYYHRFLRVFPFFLLIFLLASCSGTKKESTQSSGAASSVENSIEMSALEQGSGEAWPADRSATIDHQDPKVWICEGYNDFIYGADRVSLLPDQNKYRFVYHVEEDVIDVVYDFPAHAKLNDIEIEEPIKVVYRYDFKQNQFSELRQENKNGETVDIFPINEENMAYMAEKNKRGVTR